MAYNTEELIKQSLEAIEKHKLFFIDDVVSYLPCSRSTFYEKELDKSDIIKEALTKVKTDIKVSMRSKWYKSENATLQMGLMKLISNDEERKRLSQTYSDFTTDGKELKINAIFSKDILNVPTNDGTPEDRETE